LKTGSDLVDVTLGGRLFHTFAASATASMETNVTSVCQTPWRNRWYLIQPLINRKTRYFMTYFLDPNSAIVSAVLWPPIIYLCIYLLTQTKVPGAT